MLFYFDDGKKAQKKKNAKQQPFRIEQSNTYDVEIDGEYIFLGGNKFSSE